MLTVNYLLSVIWEKKQVYSVVVANILMLHRLPAGILIWFSIYPAFKMDFNIMQATQLFSEETDVQGTECSIVWMSVNWGSNKNKKK